VVVEAVVGERDLEHLDRVTRVAKRAGQDARILHGDEPVPVPWMSSVRGSGRSTQVLAEARR
jgi:hypothetical protein